MLLNVFDCKHSSKNANKLIEAEFIDSGVLTWTPTNTTRNLTNNPTLSVQAEDTNGGSSELVIPIQLCICINNGTCLFDETLDENDNSEVIRFDK